MPKTQRHTEIHIVPEHDLQDHQEAQTCWCQPKCELIERSILVVHNSADGRELIERHGVN